MTNSDTCVIPYDELLDESPKAKKFQIGDDQVWIPLSQLKDETDEYITIPQWLAVERGLEAYALD